MTPPQYMYAHLQGHPASGGLRRACKLRIGAILAWTVAGGLAFSHELFPLSHGPSSDGTHALLPFSCLYLRWRLYFPTVLSHILYRGMFAPRPMNVFHNISFWSFNGPSLSHCPTRRTKEPAVATTGGGKSSSSSSTSSSSSSSYSSSSSSTYDLLLITYYLLLMLLIHNCETRTFGS